MNADTKQFVGELGSVEPSAAALYDLVEKYESLEVESLVEPILMFMEKHSDADLGSPGPLVHLIEKSYPSYMGALKESILRKPTDLTVWMLNRVLNAKLEDSQRNELIELMRLASSHPEADEAAKQEAMGFLDHQSKRRSG